MKVKNKEGLSPGAVVKTLEKEFSWLRYYHLMRWLKAKEIPHSRSGNGKRANYYVRVADVREFILSLKN